MGRIVISIFHSDETKNLHEQIAQKLSVSTFVPKCSQSNPFEWRFVYLPQLQFSFSIADQKYETYGGEYTKELYISLRKVSNKQCNMLVDGLAEQLDEFIRTGEIDTPFGYFLTHVPRFEPLGEYKTNIKDQHELEQIVKTFYGIEEDDDPEYDYDTSEDSDDGEVFF